MQFYKSGVAKLKAAATIEITPSRLEQSRGPKLDEPGPSRGPHDARVTITEFSDFQCPYCRESHEILKQIVSEYEPDVRLVFKHFPLSNKGLSYSSSIASSCADQQDGFWEYHDALFESKVLSPIFLRQIAMKLGLDVDEFEKCTAAEATRDLVSQDLAEGKKLGINGTPTFIVNGKIYRGKLGVAEFKKIIELELWSSREDSDLD
jgi:protein-disulfide isomerase